MGVADFTVDFSPLGELGTIYRQAQQRRTLEDALNSLPAGATLADLGKVPIGTLLKAGDQGMSLAKLGQSQQQQDRSYGLQERQIALQEKSADDAAKGYDYREIEDPVTGGKRFIRIEKATGNITEPQIAGASTTPQNPYMTGGKMNEAQSKDALYANRMMQAERVLRTIDADTTNNPIEKFRGAISDKIGYNVRSPEYQKFDQAQRDFINATLRRESGAVISEAEFANARQQYFPQPGDTADVIMQKRQNRMEAIRGIGAGAGQGYRPEFKFDDKGEIVANPRPQQQQSVRTPSAADIAAVRANPRAALVEAQKAIAAGADPVKVAARLKQLGINLPGLSGGVGAASSGAIY